MKSTLAALFAGTALASATTITINQDAPGLLDFSIDWGQTIDPYGTVAVGKGGSSVEWHTGSSRNPNYYFGEIHDKSLPNIYGFGLTFAPVEWTGPVYTALADAKTSNGEVLNLHGNPYGARWVYGASVIEVASRPQGNSVPDGGSTALILCLGCAGLCAFRRVT